MTEEMTLDESLNILCDFMLEHIDVMEDLLRDSILAKKEHCFRGCEKRTQEGSEFVINKTIVGTEGSCNPRACNSGNAVSWYHTHPVLPEEYLEEGEEENGYSAHDWIKSLSESLPVMCLGYPRLDGTHQIGCQKINTMMYSSYKPAVQAYRESFYDLKADAEKYTATRRWGDFGRLLGHMTKFEEDMTEGARAKKEITPDQEHNLQYYNSILDTINSDPTFAKPCRS